MKNIRSQIKIAVVGSGLCSKQEADVAEKTGELIAQKNFILLCGGLSGIMEATAKGAKKAGGLTIGILPGVKRSSANNYIDIPIITGLGEARNLLIVRNADAIIAIGGGFGTLSEIALAKKIGVPVVGINTWQLYKDGVKSDEIVETQTPTEAIEKAINIINLRHRDEYNC